MFAIKSNPTSPAKRWCKHIQNRYMKRFNDKKIMHVPNIKKMEFKKTNRKRLVSVKYKHYHLFKDNPYATRVSSIHKLSHVNYFMASMVFGDGGQYYIKMPEGYHQFLEIHRNKLLSDQVVETLNGTNSPINWLPTASMCFSLKIRNSRRNRIAESAGTFCKVLWHDPDRPTTAIYFPSQKFVRVNSTSPVRLGRVSNSYHNYTVYGNARNSIRKRKKIISVRGIAMNPVDHPNGGRTNTKQPYKNPWGKIAKKGR